MCFSADPDQYAKKRYILVVFQWEGGGGGPDPLPPPSGSAHELVCNGNLIFGI